MSLLSSWKLYFLGAGALFGVAAAMDKLSSDELRSRVREIMMRDHSIRKMSLSEFTAFYIENTFARIFLGNHLSITNMVKAGAITIVALFCIIITYSVVHELSPLYFFEFAVNQPPHLKATYVAIVIGVVILNDLVSILQTAMFMRFVGSIRSFADMLFLAFCDLIITVNIFVFVFPIAMAAIFRIDDMTGRSVHMYVSARTLMGEEAGTSIKQKNKGTPGEKLGEFERGPRDLSFEDGVLYAKEFDQFVKNNRVRVDELSIESYQTLHHGEKESIIPTEVYVASNGINLSDVSKLVWQAFGMTPDHTQPPKADDVLAEVLRRGRTFEHGVLDLSDGFRNTSNWSLYSVSYAHSHAVQDRFLALAFLQLVEQSIKSTLASFSESYMEIPHRRAREFILSCDSKLTFEDVLPDISKCKTYAVAYVGPALRKVYYFARILEPPVESIVISVFASTGLFLAILFYASLALYVLSALILKAAWALGAGRGWFDLQKNPFAVAAGIIIVAGIPIGLVVAHMVSLVVGS